MRLRLGNHIVNTDKVAHITHVSNGNELEGSSSLRFIYEDGSYFEVTGQDAEKVWDTVCLEADRGWKNPEQIDVSAGGPYTPQ